MSNMDVALWSRIARRLLRAAAAATSRPCPLRAQQARVDTDAHRTQCGHCENQQAQIGTRNVRRGGVDGL